MFEKVSVFTKIGILSPEYYFTVTKATVYMMKEKSSLSICLLVVLNIPGKCEASPSQIPLKRF